MNSEIQNIKQRFEIIGSNDGLDRAIEKAVRVSPTREKIHYLGILDLITKSMITFLQELKREGDLILMNRMEELVGVVLIKHHTLSLHLDMYKTS